MAYKLISAISIGLAAVKVDAAPGLSSRQSSGTAVVSLSNNTGTPEHLASGIIFGIPNNASQIPDNMYTDWGFNFGRGGGPQLPSPALGWVAGRSQYKNRMAQTMGNYRAAEKFGAKFIFLFETLFGQWDVQNGPYPGDNGNWTQWDAFTQAVIYDLKHTYVVNFDNFIVEIFNEVDNYGYYTRPESQALEMWRRSYVAFREAFGNSVTIQGPSSAGQPSLSYGWWTQWAQYVKTNNVVPDTWTWHMESGSDNMLQATADFHAVLDQYGLPYNNININEYAVSSEQVPSGGAWWISQLERVNVPGLRGNWQNYPGLYDYLANLVSKPGAPNNDTPTETGYYPNGEYQVYKYYAQNMTGYRVGTMPSPDMVTDVYATVDPNAKVVKVLSGNRQQKGTWTIQVQNLTALGLPASGELTIVCREFVGNGYWGEVGPPSSCGTYPNSSYSNNELNIGLYQTDTTTTYAWEFAY